MFELIAILGLSAIVVSCTVNLMEMAFYSPDDVSDTSAEQGEASPEKHIA
ncbi:MAG: hypothetical protein LIO41_05825 [Ruminococcus sp.]|nr:hypothetical protein [Ruminococcus sp.]